MGWLCRPGGTEMAATWEKLSDKPRDRALYKNPATGTIRVAYQAVELKDGRRIRVQKYESFPRNREYRITLDDGTSKRVGVEVFARDFKAQRDRERGAGKVRDVAADDMALADFYRRWLECPSTRTGKSRRASTQAAVESSWRLYIAPRFEGELLRSITVSDVLDWDAALKCGAATRNKAVRTLGSILRAAVAEGLIPSDPTAKLKAQDRVRAITAHEVFTEEQIGKLREAVPERYRLMIDLLSYGMRIGEVIGLRRSSVNLKGDVKIDRQVTEVGGPLVEGPPKSDNGNRTLPLAHLAAELQRHVGLYAEPEADGFVFTGDKGKAPIRASSWRRRIFAPALTAAGLPAVTPHALRHRIACDLADEGYTDVQIAEWLGDSPATVGLVYRNVLVRNREKIAKLLAERWATANGGP